MSKKLTRRSFLVGSAAAAVVAGLSACSGSGNSAPYPRGNGYTETTTEDGYNVVDNGRGKQLSYSPESGLRLIEKDGYAFKDFEGTGELVPYEDWRLSASERADDLAGRLSIEQIAGLMCFSAHQRELKEDELVNDERKKFLDGNVRAVLNAMSTYPAFKQAEFSNAMQAYAESSDNKIPVLFSSDPRAGKNCTDWPGNLALAAAFDPQVAKEAGQGIARDMGVTMFLGPQTDIASDPRWARFNGTFGEDPALSRDTVKSFIDGLQSTVDDKGEDQGWGTKSLVSMVKHWPAEGPGEGGREGYTDSGKFAVYPGKNFEALTIPFVDGAFKLDGKTGSAATVMTSYTIAFDENNEYGELVGSGFSERKITELLRGKYNFVGGACTDWAVLNDPGNGIWTCWGLEDTSRWNPAKRAAKAVSVGVDQMGGCNDPTLLVSAYESMKAEVGEEKAKDNFTNVAKSLLLAYFNAGLFEDPYVSVSKAKKDIDKVDENDETVQAALEAQVKGIVMLKNHGNVIRKSEDSVKPKAYVPMRFTPEATTASGMGAVKWTTSSAKCELPLTQGTLQKYFDIVTDGLSENLSGPVDEKTGKATPTEADLIRLTAADIGDVDFVLVCAQAPNNASSRRGVDQDGNYIPLSLQYRPYTADGANVRQTSIAGDPADGSKWAEHESAEGIEMENRSYYGRTSMITNESQLDQILDAAKLAKEVGKPCIVILDITQPMCVYEFETEVDAILVSMSGSTEAACKIVAGQSEPSGLLPMQMPKDMDTVEKQLEDVPRDMDCYVDADGNEYDFAFGLNYSGKISDERTKKYAVDPLTHPEA
ncbi:glycoside hydrolase family 3 domain protein [Olsenella uli DSM 7084]|uniref:beta-glucosidase n=1 Tax=Olsenella uli (strain ATCC 49627 / DSM 7084 / CCUG 31166 / CIP 109912 / JCM 12494 / LMG 11480 / NCIMB 702895 / VPI D76D-27C) TaxID=633147 RepID=E1QXG0_OLSUV|nr:glycoside hydrolase family 3 N-terminal domain-containing protein [Olsenella uli]ADK68813.1 glycoside hydrolase family 3 domain protein [Olsenella uli DSM 7084]KRO12296.1 glycoside hydrolase family protein [Olsenella uli DSM 7084]